MPLEVNRIYEFIPTSLASLTPKMSSKMFTKDISRKVKEARSKLKFL